MMIIKITEEIRNNLLAFLNRMDLKGAEVPAFVEILNAIHNAQPDKEV